MVRCSKRSALSERPLTNTVCVCARSFQLRDALRVGNIFLSEKFFPTEMSVHEARKTIRDELCRFAIITGSNASAVSIRPVPIDHC